MRTPTNKDKFKIAVTERFLASFDAIAQRHGLTAAELCDIIDIYKTRIAYFRRMEKAPTTEEIAKLCSKYKISLYYIILGKADEKNAITPPTKLTNPTNQDIYREILELKALLKKK